jgi:hypothetical protein
MKKRSSAQSHPPIPRGQVSIPPEIFEHLKGLQQLKGGLTAFTERAGIKSDTLRLAMKRGTTTERTLQRIRNAVERAGLPMLNGKSRTALATVATSNGHVEAMIGQIAHLPPAVLRRVQRVSSALLDGMQLMQLTVLKVIQEELAEESIPTPPKGR